MTLDQPVREWTDDDLVRAAARPRRPGDREAALAEVWNRYRDPVAAYCARLLDEIHDAEDAVAQTFMAAFTDLIKGRGPEDPAKLRRWLYGIARNRCREEWRRRKRVGPMPEYETEDEDAEYERASRHRQAEVDRMLAVVKRSLSEKQRLVHELSVEQGLSGAVLASRLGVGAAQAMRLAHENKSRLVKGFGALVLARDGRPYCPDLAKILDEYGWDGLRTFSMSLRQRIVRHFDDCEVCDRCPKCAERRRRLIRPYIPALVPPLLGAGLFERVMDGVRDHTGEDAGHQAEGRDDDGERPPPDGRGVRLAAAALTALVVLVTAGAGAAVLGILPGFQKVAVRITVLTAVAAVTDIPGEAAGCTVDTAGPRTDCTKTLSVPKGRTTPITVVPEAGSGISLRYFGCDDRSSSGSPSCVLTPTGGRAICITTTDPRDLPNAAACRRMTT